MSSYLYTLLVLGKTKSNCYILSDGDEVVVIDPGEESLKIDAEIKKRSSDPKLKILITHGHIDQIYSTCFLVDRKSVV